MSKQKVLELRRRILSGENLSQEELQSDEAYLAEYECPFTKNIYLVSDRCPRCKYYSYCEAIE